MKVKISVIVPNYNHSLFLRQRLESIFNQTYQDFEVILLDDCSTDESWKILQSYSTNPKVSFCIRNEINSGSTFKQWKKGMDLAQGEWIWIAESDDWAESKFLEELIGLGDDSVVLKNCCSLRVVDDKIIQKHISWDYLDSKSSIRWTDYYNNDGMSEICEYLSLINIFPNASAVIFKKPLSFPDIILEMKYSGDWYFWISLLENGRVAYSPKCFNYYRYHLQTTRAIKNLSNESKRLTEGLFCVNKAREVCGKNKLSFLDCKQYKHISKFVFETNFKFGRIKRNSMFPEIPFYLLPYYYFYFFKSFIKHD